MGNSPSKQIESKPVITQEEYFSRLKNEIELIKQNIEKEKQNYQKTKMLNIIIMKMKL